MARQSQQVITASALEDLTRGLLDWQSFPPEIQCFCAFAGQYATCDPVRVLALLLPTFQSLCGPHVVTSPSHGALVCTIFIVSPDLCLRLGCHALLNGLQDASIHALSIQEGHSAEASRLQTLFNASLDTAASTLPRVRVLKKAAPRGAPPVYDELNLPVFCQDELTPSSARDLLTHLGSIVHFAPAIRCSVFAAAPAGSSSFSQSVFKLATESCRAAPLLLQAPTVHRLSSHIATTRTDLASFTSVRPTDAVRAAHARMVLANATAFACYDVRALLTVQHAALKELFTVVLVHAVKACAIKHRYAGSTLLTKCKTPTSRPLTEAAEV